MLELNKRFFAFAGVLLLIIAVVGGIYFYSVNNRSSRVPKPDEVVVTKLPNGNQLVENKTQGYKAEVSQDWYLERNAVGPAFYPDYDPTNSQSVKCKIETAIFVYSGVLDLGIWVTKHLHEDSTVSIKERDRQLLLIAGYQAIKWIGKADNVNTLLAYIGAPSKIYEIAPSTLDGSDVIKGCSSELDRFLSKFSIE